MDGVTSAGDLRGNKADGVDGVSFAWVDDETDGKDVLSFSVLRPRPSKPSTANDVCWVKIAFFQQQLLDYLIHQKTPQCHLCH